MSGSFNVDGDATITGNVTINGTASVENLIVKQIGYSSGSNQLGDAANDVQTLYGTVRIPTGSLIVTGSITQTASTASFGGLVNIGTTASRFNLTIPDNGRIGSDYALDSYIQLGNAIGLVANYNVYTLRNLAVGAGDISARLGVKGSGATSSTTALLVQNSNLSSSLQVKDDGSVIASNYLQFASDGAGNNYLYFFRNSPNTWILGSAGVGNIFTIAGNSITLQQDTIIQRAGLTVSPTISTPSPLVVNHTWNEASTVFATLDINVTNTLSQTGSKLIDVAIANTSSFVLDRNFNLGIKTSTPSASLHVVGNTILSGSAGTGSALTVYKSGSTVVDVQGSSGQLFSVTDSLSGSLFSVNTAAGLPTIEAFSDNTVNIGKFGTYPIKVVSLGTSAVVSGSFSGSGADLSGIPASAIVGLNLSQIATGSVTASVGLGTGSFSIVSGSSNFLFINNSGSIGVSTSTPFSDIPNVGRGSIDLVNPNGNVTVGGFAVLGKTSTNGYGAVGSNYYLDNANAIRRRYNDFFSAIGFEAGGFAFLSAGGGAVGSSISATYLAVLNYLGNFTIGNGSTTLGARIGIKGSGATSSTTSLLVQNSAGTTLMSIADNGAINIGAGNITTFSGTVQNNTGPIQALSFFTAGSPFNFGTTSIYTITGTATDVTSGQRDGFLGQFTFAPTSGTAVLNVFNASPTINQTGGANGITRGLYVNPTLTSAADFRAIETTSGSVTFGGNTQVTVTGSLTLTNAFTASSAIISGNVTVLGTASINTLIVNQTQLSTGSNQLGDAADDFQTLYGTVRIPTGSLTVTGSTNITGSASITGVVTVGGIKGLTDYSIVRSDNSAYIQFYNSPLVVDFTAAATRISSGRLETSVNGSFGLLGASPVRLHVRGSGTTSSTTALLVENANASASLIVRDDQNVEIQGGLAVTGVTGSWIIEARGISNSGGIRRVGNNVEFFGLSYVGGFIGGYGTLNIRGYSGGSTGNTTTSAATIADTFNYNASSANTPGLTISPAINQTGTGTFTLLNFSPTINTTGSGISYYISSSNYVVTSLGNVGIKTSTPSASLHVVGNTILSGSAGTGSAFTVYKSGSTVMSIQGSQGELFSITDSLSGSLFSVSNVSGLPILEVFSDNTTLVGDYLAPALITTKRMTVNSGSTAIYSLPTASYDGAFFDYTIKSGSNARAGSIFGTYISTTASYTDTSTFDIGDTTGVTFALIVSGSNMVLTGSASTSGWALKTIIRSI